MNKKEVFDYISENLKEYNSISDKIWDYAETAFEEFLSVDILCKSLEEHGFKVEKGIGGIETAFSGRFGEGSPVIGILGEFDALSGLSQCSATAEKKAIEAGGNGHGCGHNIFGAASLAAAVAVKEYIKANGKGTVIYYGCPGEEGGSGKAFMAREKLFDELDIAYAWHPSGFNVVMDVSSLANYQVKYKFKGIASHAAATPHLGRSALDAVELMNVGVNFLREHVIQEARIHYAIVNAGGFSPNVVQPEAEVLYLIRAPKSDQVEEIYQRINKIANGAAMMTETELEIDFIKACANIVPNKTLFEVMHKNFSEFDLPAFTAEEEKLAEEINQTLEGRKIEFKGMMNLTEDQIIEYKEKLGNKNLCDVVLPFNKDMESPVMPGSSDVGDVSWNVPTGQITTVCHTMITPAHSWQLVAQGRTGIAHKGLEVAAKVMAGASIDAIEDENIIIEAKKELERRLNGSKYNCAIPKDVMPKAISKL